MGILAIYDVTGIQEYIFSSPKMKENLGASRIVQDLLEKYLVDAIKKIGEEKQEKVITDEWKDADKFSIKSVLSEVIYIGGGNALVAFRDLDTAKEVTRELSRQVLEISSNTLRFAVAYQKTNFDNYFDDKEAVFKELKKKKQEMVQTFPLLGIAVTREGATDSLPAMREYKEEKVFLSSPAYRKRKMEKDSCESYRALLIEILREVNENCPSSASSVYGIDDYEIPREFDDLGQGEGESHIAVVHIDGNNMGSKIDKLVEGETDYDKAVRKMRSLSLKITKKYRNAMKEVIKLIIKEINDPDSELSKQLSLVPTQKHRLKLPIRPLVLNGDDVTFVCNGKIGISCAEAFLREITTEIDIEGEKIPLSACGGVAIVRSHFPFYRAYRLAEELCQSAKKKGKIILEKMRGECDDNITMGSWLDYHIVYSGITSEIKEIRKLQYNVQGMDAPPKLETGNKEMEFTQYNLLWRPWCVAGDLRCEEKYRWEKLKGIYTEFTKEENPSTGEKKWARSKLKSLRNEFIKTEEDVKFLVKQLESRELSLPSFINKKTDPFPDSRQTPYFDALELLDFYLEIL